MPAHTKLVLSRDQMIILNQDAAQVMHEISAATRSADFDGFVQLTRAGGDTVFVAVDKILYVESE
jgi:hypothetical protein